MRDYTLTKIKAYLKGDWIDSAQHQSDKNHPSFVRFNYFSGNRGTLDSYQQLNDKVAWMSCPPIFEIHQPGQTFFMTTMGLYSVKPDTLAIKLLSNRRLVFSNEGKILVFRKVIK